MSDDDTKLPAWSITLTNGNKVTLVREENAERNMLEFRHHERDTATTIVLSDAALAAVVVLAVTGLVVWWPGAARWSPLLVFGQTSLFVYWVHVEIVYGFVTYPIRHEFSIAGALVAYAVFTVMMLGLAVMWQRRERGPLIPASLRT